MSVQRQVLSVRFTARQMAEVSSGLYSLSVEPHLRESHQVTADELAGLSKTFEGMERGIATFDAHLADLIASLLANSCEIDKDEKLCFTRAELGQLRSMRKGIKAIRSAQAKLGVIVQGRGGRQ